MDHRCFHHRLPQAWRELIFEKDQVMVSREQVCVFGQDDFWCTRSPTRCART